MQLTLDQQILSFFLPEKTLLFFDIVSGGRTETSIQITLEEKNNPPLEERHRGMSVLSKGFTDITITDFPARGRRVELTFRRRRWRAGDEMLTRDIHLTAPDTRLEKEFADFLKARGGYEAHCPRRDRGCSPPPSQGFRPSVPGSPQRIPVMDGEGACGAVAGVSPEHRGSPEH